MSENPISTDRRAFLKTGSLVAAPLAMAGPMAALAADDGRAKLARLEDECAVEALQRKFLRDLNGGEDCGAYIASSDAVELGEGLRAIAEDLGHEIELTLTDPSTNTVLWTEQFEESEPVAQQTPEGLARALSIAMQRIAVKVAPALGQLAKQRSAAPTVGRLAN